MAVTAGTKVVKDGLVFHYDISNNQKSWKGKPTTNIAPNTNYSNRTYYVGSNIGGWGGDSATVYYYPKGGYNNLPYKKMVKTAGGTGGSYIDEHQFFTLVEGKTYYVSCWMKASRPLTLNGYALDLNRNADNAYRIGATPVLTTEWSLIKWNYTCAAGEGGNTYHSRQIVYVDDLLPTEIYWCGFQVEEIGYSPYVNGTRSNTQAILDLKKTNTITPNNMELSSNEALVFDGTNDYVDTGIDISWNNTNKASMTFVLKSSNLSQGNAPIAGKMYPDWEWAFYQQGTSLSMVYWNSGGGHTNGMDWSVGNFFTSTSQYVIFQYVWDGATSYIYRNGVLVGTKTATDPSINQNRTNNVLLGGHIYVWGDYYWGGSIAQTQFYNRALSSQEVLNNFESIRSRYGV
jgi:Concanavalin A-like lectin/glucanases superfamily